MERSDLGRCTIIAEVGSVHDGSLGIAKRLIAVAASCGVDAVKFQTHIAAAETLVDAPMPSFFTGEPRYRYFERTGFDPDAWRSLREECEAKGVRFLSSPFSVAAVELLEQVGAGWYKVPSGEVTNLPLLDAIGATGKPVLLSSGMSSWAELDAAVARLRAHHEQITVLQCTSEYPCEPEHVGLNVLGQLRERYGLPVGLSDHTLGLAAPVAAITLGATVIEKHFTLSRELYGSDARHSIEPDELRAMVQGIREVERMLANPVDKDDTSQFAQIKMVFEKSIVSVVPIARGTLIAKEMLDIKKPGTGLPPARLPDVIGRRAARDLPADAVLIDADVRWDADDRAAGNGSSVA